MSVYIIDVCLKYVSVNEKRLNWKIKVKYTEHINWLIGGEYTEKNCLSPFFNLNSVCDDGTNR